MAWVRESPIQAAKKGISALLTELEREYHAVGSALVCMSYEEWNDWLNDLEKLLAFKDKQNSSIVDDQWDDIQRRRIEMVRKALNLKPEGGA